MHTMFLASLLVTLLVLIVLLPYDWGETSDFLERRSGYWRSALYTYSYGPDFERVEFDGLRQLQYTILDLMKALWAALRSDLLRRLVAALARYLG